MATTHPHACRFVLELLRITDDDETHVKLFHRGGRDTVFAHLKAIGPTLKGSNPRNAHLAVTLASGEVAVTDALVAVPGVIPRPLHPNNTPSLGRFTYRIDPVVIDANGRSFEQIVGELVVDLVRQNFW